MGELVYRGRFQLLATLVVAAAMGMVVFWLLGARGSGLARAQNIPPPAQFNYSVKVVCTGDEGGVLGDADGVIVPVDTYATEVNVHNPHGLPASLDWWLTLSHQPGWPPIMSASRSDDLFALDAVAFDCRHMRGLLPDLERVPGGTGFLVIRSNRELDVVAVYSALEKTSCSTNRPRDVLHGNFGTNCKGAGVSTDVEYIRPTLVEPVADLTVELNGIPEQRCGVQSCLYTVSFLMRNLGDRDVTETFYVTVSVDNAVSPVTIPWTLGVPARSAVDHTGVLVNTVGSCYDPDCTVSVYIDSTGEVLESNEGNNEASTTFPG